VDFFVNNAGFSQSGEFLSHDPSQEQAEVEGECSGAGRSHASLWQSNGSSRQNGIKFCLERQLSTSV
jgi:hypothetical protein